MEPPGKGKATVSDDQGEFATSVNVGFGPYWHDHIAGRAAAYFLRGRLRFGDGGNSVPFPSALAVCGAGPETLSALDAALLGFWRAV